MMNFLFAAGISAVPHFLAPRLNLIMRQAH
jgi:hypothetical protein